jgi:hypothetical protein
MSIFQFSSNNKWVARNNTEIVGTEIKGTGQQWQVTHVDDASCEFMFHRSNVTYFNKFFANNKFIVIVIVVIFAVASSEMWRGYNSMTYLFTSTRS